MAAQVADAAEWFAERARQLDGGDGAVLGKAIETLPGGGLIGSAVESIAGNGDGDDSGDDGYGGRHHARGG